MRRRPSAIKLMTMIAVLAVAAGAYVIKPDNTVEIRPITVAQISDGQALIDSGLTANERVVVDGQYKLQPSIPVTVTGANFRAEGESESGKCDSSYE